MSKSTAILAVLLAGLIVLLMSRYAGWLPPSDQGATLFIISQVLIPLTVGALANRWLLGTLLAVVTLVALLIISAYLFDSDRAGAGLLTQLLTALVPWSFAAAVLGALGVALRRLAGLMHRGKLPAAVKLLQVLLIITVSMWVTAALFDTCEQSLRMGNNWIGHCYFLGG